MEFKDAPPRKVVVGTAMYAMWGEYPGVEKRLAALGEIIDEMVEKRVRSKIWAVLRARG